LAYSRFGIYYLPPADGEWAAFGARWLGWDAAGGRAVAQYDLAGLAAMPATPRKYGFHATLKPPFRLAPGRDSAGLAEATAALAGTLPPVTLPGLEAAAPGRFLALVPPGACPALCDMAARLVRDLDVFRAPLSEAELARRRGALTARQEANLVCWGYPYVMADFRFHLTLTGKLPAPARAEAQAALARVMPNCAAPVTVGEIALVGERGDGMFEALHRYPLGG